MFNQKKRVDIETGSLNIKNFVKGLSNDCRMIVINHAFEDKTPENLINALRGEVIASFYTNYDRSINLSTAHWTTFDCQRTDP